MSPEPGPVSGRFGRDVAWNVASLAVLGASGVALNVVIGNVYDAATLGVFNQVLAAYVFFSQIAVGGTNVSALKLVAEAPEDRERATGIVVGSLVVAVGLGAATTIAFVAAAEPAARWLESPGVAAGMRAAAPGLFVFGLNKVLLSTVNGLRRMRAFAALTAARWGLVLLGLLVCVARDPERARGEELAFAFTFAEGILFLLLAVEVGRQLRFPVRAAWKSWVPVHLAYGSKSVASGVLLELNSRVDVWMIGIWMSDAAVGVYTAAAMVAEGLFQLLVVLQNNVNPVIARMVAEGRLDALRAAVARGRRSTYLGMAAVAAVAIALFPHLVRALFGGEEYREAWLPFALLMLGIVSASGYVPFGQVLLMAGRPGWHSAFVASAVALNVAGNAILVPRHGLAGAAAATAASVLLSVLVLKAIVRRELGVRI